MMGRLLRIGAIVTGCLALAAYDTRVETAIPWQSIYQAGQPASIPEHTTIADDTFDYLDPSGQLRALFGRNGEATLDVVDLNASHFRYDLLYGVETYGDDPLTEAEERTIPAPGLFAGLPDFSYAIYDWLNKNRTCPAFNEAEYTSRCHEFMGWLGALNSVHFGSQATEMYAHLHANALALAERSREMREAMTPAEREVYAAELEEADLLALAYEGYAQHFIQDRWAMGHMWKRWNAPDTSQVEASLPEHLAIGALAGIIHGAEALVGTTPGLDLLLMEADPMSSPLPGGGNQAHPMHYRNVRSGGPIGPPLPGTGDERYADMVAGIFSLARYDPSRANQALLVAQQMQSLRECAGAGWAEVIRALGPGDNGGYGQFNAPLSANAPDFAVVEHEDCWNNWATNESMMIGLLGPNPGRSVALLGALDIAVPVDVMITSSDTRPVVGARAELVTYATRLWLYGRDEPDGVQISTGQMTSAAQSFADRIGLGREFNPNTLWSFSHGGNFSLPEYAVPVGLSMEAGHGTVAPLTEEDLRGRDVQTLYGVFSGANSDYWCENRDIFETLRADPTLLNRELCETLAQRMFQGTHPDYQGPQAWRREDNDRPIRSMCRIRRTSGVESETYDDHANPYWLDQGYEPAEDHNQNLTPRHTDIAAITNWCARAPILTLLGDEELRNDNIAERIGPDDTYMALIGQDFGTDPGQVRLTDPQSGEVYDLTRHATWSSNRIDLDVAHLDLEDGQDYRIGLTLAREAEDAGPIEMPGLYYLRIQDPPEMEFTSLDLGGVGPCMDEVPEFQIVDIEAFLENSFHPDGFSALAEQYYSDVTPLVDYLRRQAGCMRELHQQALPVLQRTDDYSFGIMVSQNGIYQGQLPVLMSFTMDSIYRADADPIDGRDLYDVYIQHVEGLAWFLERSANLLFAWDEAINGDEVLERNGLSYSDWMMAAVDRDAALEAGFERNEFGSMADLPQATADMLRESRLQMTAMVIGMDLMVVGPVSVDVTRETLAGLPIWTQVQHSLVNSALPMVYVETNSVSSQLDAETARALAEYTPENCTRPGEGTCILFLDTEAIDTSAMDAAIGWVDDIMGNSVAIDQLRLSGVTIAHHRYPDGGYHSFRGWPTPERAEAAANGIIVARARQNNP